MARRLKKVKKLEERIAPSVLGLGGGDRPYPGGGHIDTHTEANVDASASVDASANVDASNAEVAASSGMSVDAVVDGRIVVIEVGGIDVGGAGKGGFEWHKF